MTDPTPPLDLDKVRKRHCRETLREYFPFKPNCCKCQQPWPCDAIRLVGEVERLQDIVTGYRRAQGDGEGGEDG